MTIGKDILKIAVSQLGIKEQPANSNKVKFNTWYYGREVSGSAYPWCMAFAQWCYDQAGIPLPLKTASCGELLRWYRAHQPECITTKPMVGSLVIFDFPGGASTDHVGILEGVGGTTVTTIDGNTGVTSEANGGCVMRRTRDKKYVAAFITPRELEEEMPRYNTVAEIKGATPWAMETIMKLINQKALTGGGKKDSEGLPADLDLSGDMLRMLVINDRMGLYKNKYQTG